MPVRLAYHLHQLFWVGLDWVYPPICAGCGAQGERWCQSCAESVELFSGPLCILCGQPQSVEGVCRECQAICPAYTAARSWAAYRGALRNAILALKYRRNVALGETLAQPLPEFVHRLGWSIDLVTVVPLGLARLAERGYNQAALLARPMAWNLGLPYQPKALRRVRETATQVGKSAAMRRKNVMGAFEAMSRVVSDKNVLVMDDVATTGSTLEACAQALRGAGARTVYALTLARSVFEGTPQII